MPEPQINVTVKKQGCGSGCATFILILFAIGVVLVYWYVAIPLVLLAIAGVIIYLRRQPAQEPEKTAAPPQP